MTTFSEKYPYAYHVFPLHAARGIWKTSSLLSKTARRQAGMLHARPSTAGIDSLLGFSDVVHLYVPPRARSISELPILRAQLGPANVAPFPHAAIKVDTRRLLDDDCLICCWNIAVSRPQVPTREVKPGNWARGTRAERIREVWRWFRETAPDVSAARGRWVDGFEVPLILGKEVVATFRALGSDQRAMPELLLKSPFNLEAPTELCVFSDDDERCLQRLGAAAGGIPVARESFPGYSGAPRATYDAIAAYFEADGDGAPEFVFDAVRGGSDGARRRRRKPS
jgi:hypothetical protein